MWWKIFSFIFLSSFLYATQIFAVYVKKNDITFLKNPLIITKNAKIQAKKGKIVNNIIYLEGNVSIFYENSNILANKAEIYTNNIKLKKTFLFDKTNQIWIRAENSVKKSNNILVNNFVVSSCCVENPDWFFFVKKGEYNTKTKFIKLKDIKLYIGKIPVFYFPYYATYLSKKRRSGLLTPYIGISSQDGLLFSQPIYIVLGNRADLEITPTIRTKRGKGVYSTFRFVTTPYDYGKIQLGEFIDFDSYNKKHNLAYNKHYGFSFYYKNDKVFSKYDKLYTDIKYTNDIEFFYLRPDNYHFLKPVIGNLIPSKINYIYVKDNYFIGSYFKYFIDTTSNNKNTLQTLPQINFHLFENKKFFINSLDINLYNYYSQTNKYYAFDIFFPISYMKKLFDGYLNLDLSQNFNYVGAKNNHFQKFYQSYFSLKLSTSLAKAKDYFHLVNSSITFNIKEDSYLSKNNNLLSYTKMGNIINFSLFEMFKKDNFSIIHSLNQNLNFKLAPISLFENSLKFVYNKVTISFINKFSLREKSTKYNSITLDTKFKDIKLNVNYTVNLKDDTQPSKTNSLNLEKFINKDEKIYIKYNYDFIYKYFSLIKLGLKLVKKCWQYDLSFSQNRIPLLKQEGINYVDNYSININVNFYPFGKIDQILRF